MCYDQEQRLGFLHLDISLTPLNYPAPLILLIFNPYRTSPVSSQLGKVAGIVQLKASGPDVAMSSAPIAELLGGEVGRKLGMHVVAACPLYLAPADVPQDVVERETAIFRYFLHLDWTVLVRCMCCGVYNKYVCLVRFVAQPRMLALLSNHDSAPAHCTTLHYTVLQRTDGGRKEEAGDVGAHRGGQGGQAHGRPVPALSGRLVVLGCVVSATVNIVL